MDEWDALEAFLTKTKHYWHPKYKVSYKNEELPKWNPDTFLESLGQHNCSQQEFVDEVEAGYAEFWEQRGRGDDAYDPAVKRYVKKFFEQYEKEPT
jgi:hypothetical protein